MNIEALYIAQANMMPKNIMVRKLLICGRNEYARDKGIVEPIEIAVKQTNPMTPAVYFAVNNLNLDTGSDNRVAIVPFSISPAIVLPALDTVKNIISIGHMKLNISLDMKPSRLLNARSSRPKACEKPLGKDSSSLL